MSASAIRKLLEALDALDVEAVMAMVPARGRLLAADGRHAGAPRRCAG